MTCFGEKIKNYHCKVVLLDDQELIQEIKSTSLGQELLETIFKHLNLIETSYFGLRFIDTAEQAHWLDPGKKTVKQLEDTETYILYFGVKFYAADPCKLVEEITRYQFFLQIKQDILQGRLPVPIELTPELCAYAIQSELGDYDPRRHGVGYISEFQFTSNQSPEMELKIADLHKSLIGHVPAAAELNYLEKVKWLEMYGVDLHPVLGEDNTDYFLGLTPAGVIVLRNKTKVGNYFWPRISKLNQKGKYFMLRVKNKNNEEQTYGFETPSKAACKHMWKCATEHLAFFRLVQIAPTSKSYSLNARFRDSTRSESSVRRRAQPQFVRTPSRRYQRRIVEGAQDDSEIKDVNLEITNSKSFKRTVAVPQPVEGCHQPAVLSTANHRTDSPRSTRSAPWTGSKVKPNSASVPSPKSVRSAGVGSAHVSTGEQSHERRHHRSRNRSASAESNSSGDSQSRRRHRHRRRSRRGSDAESEVSRQSGRSHGKRRHRKSGSRSRCGESENSEPENCTRKHRHHHRKSESKKYELVDSEAQWKEVQKKQSQSAVQQAAVVQSLGSPQQSSLAPVASSSRHQGITTTPSRKPGNGSEGTSEVCYNQNRRRQRRSSSHRSSSPDKRLPTELKRHLDFQLIDTEGMTEEQRREIPYHKVETSQDKTIRAGRIRHSSSLKNNSRPTQPIVPNGKVEVPRQDGKLAESGPFDSDSPPPPYSPPPAANQMMPKPPVPQKPVISSLGPSLGTKMTKSKESENRAASSYGMSLTRNHSLERSAPMTQSIQPRRFNPPQPQCPSNHVPIPNQVKRIDPMAGQNHHELGLPTSFHPSPSESPDSQKVDSHHENSDSGLGTDHHEYYKNENFSSLGYELSARNPPDVADGFKTTTIMNQKFEWTQPMLQSHNSTNKIQHYPAKPSSNYWSNVSHAESRVRQPWEAMKVNDIASPTNTATTENQQQKLANFLQQHPPKTTKNHELSTEL